MSTSSLGQISTGKGVVIESDDTAKVLQNGEWIVVEYTADNLGDRYGRGLTHSMDLRAVGSFAISDDIEGSLDDEQKADNFRVSAELQRQNGMTLLSSLAFGPGVSYIALSYSVP